MAIRYDLLPTEQQNPKSRFLDRLSAAGVIDLMNRENRTLPAAIDREKSKIARAVNLIVGSLQKGGRIFFAGAGTSGRLCVLESAELPPTFGTPPALAQALMAGGRQAVFRSQEGAEDRTEEARRRIRARAKRGDVVIAVAASGVTPFAGAALAEGRRIGARTILVTCNAQKGLRKKAEIVISPAVGPEIISGSTRLKAGTVTKMVLNMLTTAAMVRLGKVYGNRMVDLQPRSRKLRERGIRLVQELAGVSRGKARHCFTVSGGRVKEAVLIAKKGISLSQARKMLERAGGHLGEALSD